MPVRSEISDKWVRAFVGDTVVVDSRRPTLFWPEKFPIPGYAFEPADVRMDLLQPSSAQPPQDPFFFLPKGPVAQWYDLRVGDRELRHAAWTLADEELRGKVVLTWQPGVLDRWQEEDEEVFAHPRDPYKRVEAICSTRHVTVTLDGVELADSTQPVLLFETGLPTRYYLPTADVAMAALREVEHQSHCPYKGIADRYWNLPASPGRPTAEHVAWSYTWPEPAVGKVAGLMAFYNELVDITVDGEPVHRPVSVFSEAGNRP